MSNRKSTVESDSRKTIVGRHQQGQSLMELIVVITVIVFVVGALTFATIASLRNAVFAQNQAQATKLAQEALERVRVGRDRNECITNLDTSVNSWNAGNSSCLGDSIWGYQISGNGLCDDPSLGKCYFNVGLGGILTNIGFASALFPASLAEGIPTANPVFRRAVLLSDDSTYATQKTVTVIVRWSDFAGEHESKLTTILRKL